MKTLRCLSNQITTIKAWTLRTHTTNESYTRPVREPESRKTDYPFGFGINKSAPHMAKNLFHISCLSDMQVSPRSSQDWGRHRGENMEIRIWTTCILYLCITRRPPNILNSTGPFPKSLGNDNRKQYNLDLKKSFGFDRPPYHFPSWGVIVGGLADRLDWILHCVVAVL
jgi:hypothetical protein